MFNKMTSILNWLCDFTLQVFDVEHYMQFKCSAISSFVYSNTHNLKIKFRLNKVYSAHSMFEACSSEA